MIAVKQVGDLYEVKFQYDPILVSLVRQVPGRVWDSNRKLWTIPLDKLGFLISKCADTPYASQLSIQSNEHLNENCSIDATQSIPDVDLTGVELHVADGCKLFSHQLDFMKYAINNQHHADNSGFILCDQQGLGKTLEVINLAMYNKKHRDVKHCLVICCVNSAKYNWREDIIKHTNGQEVPYILGTRYRRDKIHTHCSTGNAERLTDLRMDKMYGKADGPELPYFLIVNIEAFRYKVGKLHPFTSEIIRWINNGSIGMIAIDEIHKNASPSSIQGAQLIQVKEKSTRRIEWIPMTGTPITSKPTDVYLPLKLVDGHSYSSFYAWQNRFCVKGGYGGKEIVGYKNIPMLKQMLQSHMLRRLKSQVLDLPPKLYYTEYVENTPYQQGLYNRLVQEVRSSKDSLDSRAKILSGLMKLRQVNGSPELVDDRLQVDKEYLAKNAKLRKLLELVEDAINDNEKVVIFSNWVQPLRTLYRYIASKYRTACYTGTMTTEAREAHKKMFIEDPECRVMLGTVGALGVSHTLTVASTLIFYDECWNPSDREQAEDRIHRIGATGCVKIKTIITKDTVDERVHEILSNKESISNYIVDNDLDVFNNPKLFDLLLSDTN